MFNRLREFFQQRSVSFEDKLFFIQNFSLLLKAGIPLPKTFEILAKQTSNHYWNQVILDIRNTSMRGNALDAAFEAYDHIFSPELIGMIRIGELKGDLPSVLDRYYELLNKEQEMRSKIKSAMFYPALILLAIIGVGIVTVVFIFPQMTQLFDQFQGTLPLPTRIAIAASNFVANYWYIVILVTIAAISLFISGIKTARGKYLFHLTLLHVPVISRLIKQRNLFRILRNFGILLQSGIALSTALETTALGVKNVFYRQSLLDAKTQIDKGNFIHSAFTGYQDLYPEVAIQIISVGEESGQLDEMLQQIAGFYEKKLSESLSAMSTIIEPLLILLMGGIVAFMAISILLPIYSMSDLV